MAEAVEQRLQEERERKKQEEEERKVKELNIRWAIGLTTWESILDRQANAVDPMTRHLLFVDKLCILTDVSLAALRVYAADEGNLSEENLLRTEKVANTLKKEVTALLQWIQSPAYSPDHPYGAQVMAEAKKEFQQAGRAKEVQHAKKMFSSVGG